MPNTTVIVLSVEQRNFEVWITENGHQHVPSVWLKKDELGRYIIPELRRLWEGWQGANQWHHDHKENEEGS